MGTVKIQFVDDEEFLELERCLASVEQRSNSRVNGALLTAPAKRPAAQSPTPLQHQQHVNGSKKVACTSAIKPFSESHVRERQILQAASTASVSTHEAYVVPPAAFNNSVVPHNLVLAACHIPGRDCTLQQPCLQQQQTSQWQQRQQHPNCMLAPDGSVLTGANSRRKQPKEQHPQEQHCSHTVPNECLQRDSALQQSNFQNVSVQREQQRPSVPQQQFPQQRQHEQLPLSNQDQHIAQGQHLQQLEGADRQQNTIQQQHLAGQLNPTSWHAQQQQLWQPWQQQQQQQKQQGTTLQRPVSPKSVSAHQQKQQAPQQRMPPTPAEGGLLRTHSAPAASDLQQQGRRCPEGSRSWTDGAAAASGAAAHAASAALSGGGHSGTRRRHDHQCNPAADGRRTARDCCTAEARPQPGVTGDRAVLDQVVGQYCQQQQGQRQQQAAQVLAVNSSGHTTSSTLSRQLPAHEAAGCDTALEAGVSAVSGVANAPGRRQLPRSMQETVGLAGRRQPQQQQKQHQAGPQPPQQQEQQAMLHGKPQRQFEFQGIVRYSHNPMEVDWLCRQVLDAGPPRVIGLDIEWRPTFKTGQAPNRTALLQIAYAVDKDGRDWRPRVHGRGVTVLLLHIYYTGITPALQEMLQRDDIIKVGVNIGGDVSKLLADFKVEVCGADDLSDAAHGRQLRCVEGITSNTECKRWSLAGLVEEVLGLELPKPQQIRLGNWECRPLSDEQRQYAALDAFASLLLHWELQALPERLTLSQQLRTAMRERAAAAVAATGGA